MPQALKVLVVEDNLQDAELVVRELRRAGFEPAWQRVDTEAAYLDQLQPGLDLVISDYAMPQFSGLRALELLKQRGIDLPFILVSGTIGEETAVAAMKQGAADYLLKDRLARLGEAVNHALEEGRLRRERRQADDALRIANAQLGQLLEHSPVVLYMLKLDGDRIVPRLVSENITAMLGFTVAETLSYEWWHGQLHPDDRERAVNSVTETVGTGASRTEYRLRHKDGHYCWIDDARRLIRNAAGEPGEMIGGWTDITERKRAEEVVRQASGNVARDRRNRVRIDLAILVAGTAAIYVLAARFNWFEAVSRWVLAHELAQLDETILATLFLVAGLAVFGFRRWRESESELTSRQQTQAALELLHGELDRRVKQRTGELGSANQALRGEIAERKKLEEQFLRAQRMEAIGTLASGIAHDLNNILAPMLMAAGLLKGKLTEQRDRDILSMVEHSAQRGASIIRQLLTFSRGAAGERVSIQPKHLLKEIVQIMQETFPRNIAIEQEVPNNLWIVAADATQLHQVLLNLCVNARDAMPEGGTLTLAATNLRIGEDQAPPEAKAGPHVVVAVTDTGHGIPRQDIDRIFDPFFTTKALGKGTGLGLSTVSTIVKGHGGHVTVNSEPGRGTVFKVYLPATEDTGDPVQHGSAAPMLVGHGELILVVDDEAPILEAASRVLQDYGYRALTAANGEEAIKLFIQYRETVRLVLTDVMMPVMGGVELIRALRVLAPDIRVVATSGLDQDDKREELAGLNVTDILAKPCAPSALLHAIQRALASKG
jgi:PAS domain S-box-containing protein